MENKIESLITVTMSLIVAFVLIQGMTAVSDLNDGRVQSVVASMVRK